MFVKKLRSRFAIYRRSGSASFRNAFIRNEIRQSQILNWLRLTKMDTTERHLLRINTNENKTAFLKRMFQTTLLFHTTTAKNCKPWSLYFSGNKRTCIISLSVKKLELKSTHLPSGLMEWCEWASSVNGLLLKSRCPCVSKVTSLVSALLRR